MQTQLFFSQKTDKHNTPDWLIRELALFFDWNLDVCVSSPNVCGNYFDESSDGLNQEWRGLCWMNPPYSEMMEWMTKAMSSGANVVCLVPCRTETRWWHKTVPHASQVVFIRGRLKFGGAPHNAPFPSAFVVFGELDETQRDALNVYGWNPAVNDIVVDL